MRKAKLNAAQRPFCVPSCLKCAPKYIHSFIRDGRGFLAPASQLAFMPDAQMMHESLHVAAQRQILKCMCGGRFHMTSAQDLPS